MNSSILRSAFGRLDDAKLNQITIQTTGKNDANSVTKLGIPLPPQRQKQPIRYGEIIRKLVDNVPILDRDICVKQSLESDKISIDLEHIPKKWRKNEGITFQLFKLDRYTGVTSLEVENTTNQRGLYLSKELTLIALLGVYSGFVTTALVQGKAYHYFLFFSPSEVAYLLHQGDGLLIQKYFLVKGGALNKLRGILTCSTLNELLLLELALSLELQELMNRHNLDKVSLNLLKIAMEGQTYKIYEFLPITMFGRSPFYQTLGNYSKDPAKFCAELSRHISPPSPILEALKSQNAPRRAEEADNALRAVQGLYRFVILGDPQGLFQFTRELQNCCSKLKSQDAKRVQEYQRMLTAICRHLHLGSYASQSPTSVSSGGPWILVRSESSFEL